MLRKKLRWACSKRGWVEMEVLLAEFVQHTEGLAEFNFAQLQELERVLLADDMFLMALVTQRKPVPEDFQAFYALCRFLDFAQHRLRKNIPGWRCAPASTCQQQMKCTTRCFHKMHTHKSYK